MNHRTLSKRSLHFVVSFRDYPTPSVACSFVGAVINFATAELFVLDLVFVGHANDEIVAVAAFERGDDFALVDSAEAQAAVLGSQNLVRDQAPTEILACPAFRYQPTTEVEPKQHQRVATEALLCEAIVDARHSLDYYPLSVVMNPILGLGMVPSFSKRRIDWCLDFYPEKQPH